MFFSKAKYKFKCYCKNVNLLDKTPHQEDYVKEKKAGPGLSCLGVLNCRVRVCVSAHQCLLSMHVIQLDDKYMRCNEPEEAFGSVGHVCLQARRVRSKTAARPGARRNNCVVKAALKG